MNKCFSLTAPEAEKAEVTVAAAPASGENFLGHGWSPLRVPAWQKGRGGALGSAMRAFIRS